MWDSPSALRLTALVVTGSVAAYSFADLVLDGVYHWRDPTEEKPKLRKRLGELGIGILGLLAFILTWRVEVLDAREQEAIRKQVLSLEETQREMDQAANAVAQARIGIRAGLDTLVDMSKRSDVAEVRQRVGAILKSVSDDYEQSIRDYLKLLPNVKASEVLAIDGLPPPMQPPVTIPKVVSLIRSDHDLKRIALAYAAFRELTASEIVMFDRATVEAWCRARPGSC